MYSVVIALITLQRHEDMAKMVASALVGSRLDYANSVLYGTTQKNISKLQKVQNLLDVSMVSSFVHLVLLELAHIIFSNTFTGSPSNTASTSK